MPHDKITVSLSFQGTVNVWVPGHLLDDDKIKLAERIALSRILATCDLDTNVDAPEDEAFEEAHEYSDGRVTEDDWDSCIVDGVQGGWKIEQ